jgi:hypothetical protein
MAMQGHNDAVTGVAVSPDGSRLYTAGKDRTVNGWDKNTGQLLFRAALQEGAPEAFALSGDGKRFAVAGADKNVGLYDAATGKSVQQLAHPDRVRALAFSPDGTLLVTGCDDRMVRLWDVASGKQQKQAMRHRAGVTAVAFSADGKQLASADAAGTAIVSTVAGLKDWKPEPIDLTAKQLDELWGDLGRDESGKGLKAVWTLIAGGKDATPFLKEHLKPAEGNTDSDRIARLIKDLDADDFAAREKASKDLEKVIKAAAPALKAELARDPSPEVKRRLQKLLENATPAPPTPEELRANRAVDVLEEVGTPEAKEVLQKLAKGDGAAELTLRAKAALERMDKKK